MSQTRGMAYLRRKLELKRSRVLTRYQYYEMKNAVKDFGMVTPPEFRTFSEVLGWCGKAVDSLADRLIFREFRQDNFDLNSIYLQNNADILFDSAVRHGLKQIQENPGGIILNYEQNMISLETLKDVLRKRLTASATQDVDILVICKEKLFTVQRFTAKK